MVSGPDQSNKLGVLDRDDGIVSPYFLYHILEDWLYNKSISIVKYLDKYSCIPEKQRAAITIFTSLVFSDHSKG